MGERLRSTEEALEEDKRRQEANLLKLMKARQRKNLKQTVKKIVERWRHKRSTPRESQVKRGHTA